MRIDKLVLENFRCFAQDSIRLAPRFTLLIGDNGSGKTAVLDALAIAAGSFLLGIPGVESRQIRKDEMRRTNSVSGQTLTSEFQGATVVLAFGPEWSPFFNEDVERSWFRSLSGPTSRTTRLGAAEIQKEAENLATKVSQGLDVVLPVLGYYGTGRLWSVLRDITITTTPPESRLMGYRECLNPASDVKRMFKWFKTNELISLQKRTKIHTLETVRKAVVSMIPDADGCFWDVALDELVLVYKRNGKTETQPFHLLSDGYRNLAGLAADIAYRMATLNPWLMGDVVLKTPGIVLIDEIDLHLHPKWQRTVVESLMTTFPGVQFVATTHSPTIIQSLYGRPDVMLWDLETGEEKAIPSKSIEDILEVSQGVEIPQQSQRFLEKEKVAEEYYRLLDKGSDADARELESLRMRLDELLMPFSDDPAYHAFLKMERVAAGIDQEPRT